MTGYFELFDLERTYALDVEELERRYHARSKDVHPDRFATEEASRRVEALQQSMQLNEAYKTLKKPVPRAEYLLAQHGLEIGTNEQLDPAFLMSVLEAREELATARQAGDTARLAELEDQMVDRRADAVDAVAALWAEFESSRDAAVLERVKRELILLRYLDRYLEQFEDEDD
jgi:molecular chaperone HscB